MNGATLCKRLIKDERRERGLSVAVARESIALAAGVAPGTLENLERGRLKYRYNEVVSRLSALLVRKLERKMGELEIEIMAARMFGDPHSPDVLGAAAALETARGLLSGKGQGK